jgi:hypothetical protein
MLVATAAAVAALQDSNDDDSTMYVQSDGTTGDGTTTPADSVPVNITDGSWHHVLLTTVPPAPIPGTLTVSSTSSPKGYQLYLDGQQVGQLGDASVDPGVSSNLVDTAAAPVDGGDFTSASAGRIVLCGRSDADISRSFTGRLTQLLVFDRALTAADVQRVYLAAQPGVTARSSSDAPGSAFTGDSPVAATAAAAGPPQGDSTFPDASMDFLPTPTTTISSRSSDSSSSSSGPDGVSAADVAGPFPPSTPPATTSSSSSGGGVDGSGGCVGGFQWYLPVGSACDLEPQAVRCPRYCEPGLVRGDGENGDGGVCVRLRVRRSGVCVAW